jgi:hypothetical protein
MSLERQALITYLIHDEDLFGQFREEMDTEADTLVHALLSGKPPLDCGYEIVRVEP